MRSSEVLSSGENRDGESGRFEFNTEIKGGRGESLITGEEEAMSGREGQITGKGKNSLNKLSLLYEEMVEKLEILCLQFS